jgi:outer membrane receptor protein involved in Fe transport
MIGGENKNNQGYFPLPIRAPTEQHTLYTRLKYDFSDTLIGRLDVSLGRVEGESAARQLLNTAYSIKRGNPFIPTSSNPTLDINTIMAANNLPSFTLGRNFNEYGAPPVESDNEAFRTVGSLNGELAGGWTWDTYYQYGKNDFVSTATGLGISARVTRALDAVRNSGGQIACGVNADAITTNDDPSCAPLNPFGSQASPAAAAYVLGTSVQTNAMTQHVMAGNLQGDVFETWAGPVSVATGLEYRSDEIEGKADAISRTLGFVTNNASLIGGEIDVTEGYVETIVPLASEIAFAKSLELNAAARRTFYDRSGVGTSSEVSATTWKMGAVWEPINSIRVRGTKSRDIRAPNLSELYGPKTTGFGILNDPAKGGAQNNPVVTSGSNSILVPEVAETITYGFVIQPDMDGIIGRMQLSVDYYDIEIQDSIGVLGAQTIATRCFEGATEFCSLITRDSAGFITQIDDSRQNVDKLLTKGYDVEFSFNQPLADLGNLDFRLLATYVKNLITVDSAGPIDRAGQTGLRAGTIPGMPDYTLDGLLSWSHGPMQLALHGRYIPDGIYNAAFVGPDQPGYNIALGNSSNSNSVPDAWYTDIVGQYEFSRGTDGSIVLYGAVNNLGDKDPPRTPGANGSGNNVQFDPVGRMYKVGLRVQF